MIRTKKIISPLVLIAVIVVSGCATSQITNTSELSLEQAKSDCAQLVKKSNTLQNKYTKAWNKLSPIGIKINTLRADLKTLSTASQDLLTKKDSASLTTYQQSYNRAKSDLYDATFAWDKLHKGEK